MMRRIVCILTAAAALMLPLLVQAQDAESPAFLEGLAFPDSLIWSVEEQALYFIEYGADRIARTDGETTDTVIALASGTGPSGMVRDVEGNFWVAVYNTPALIQFSPTGEELTRIDTYEGTAFRGLNDIAIDAEGGLYFTDSGNFGEDWSQGQLKGAVYYYSPDGELTRVDHQLRYPNGIEVSPDGRTLYVNEHLQNQVLAYTIHDDGTFSDETVFFRPDQGCTSMVATDCAALGPDGAAMGSDGTLYVAHYAGSKVYALSPVGAVITTYVLPEGTMPTNVAVSEQDNLLFITQGDNGNIYRLSLNGQ